MARLTNRVQAGEGPALTPPRGHCVCSLEGSPMGMRTGDQDGVGDTAWGPVQEVGA